MSRIKTFSASVAIIAGSALSAQAALVDFTDSASYTISGSTGSGSVSGIAYQISATGGNLNNSEAGPSEAGRTGPLAGTVDGLGVGDDEITFGNQSVTVTFASAVNVVSLYFLDLFGTNPGGAAEATDEMVNVSVDGGEGVVFSAQTLNQDGTVGLGAFTGLMLSGTSFTFTAMEPNDAFGSPDFALAGIEFSDIAPIPLPAGGLLLAGALGGLGFAARRRRRADV